ncbi:unnamed protein product [Adineta steineri]|uniref:Uncharacterized protein n=1 Tax=Adineta steineri TaxID=433720 RepID=A0A816G3Q6_9BILA|nr:unnamed protein product [Adineta steineri]CAF1668822.1 unnamed protein product [Adineta steineri]
MGPRCTTLQLGGDVSIPGNGNSAIIFNGIPYNISNIFNNALNITMEKYRSELIIIQFSSVFLMTILWCAIVIYISIKKTVNKDIESVLNKCDVQLETNNTRYRRYLIELDEALQEVENLLKNDYYSLQYFAQPLEYIENLYHLVRSSPDLLYIVISKLIDKNYAGLCLAVLTLKNRSPCENSEAWQSITSALTGLILFRLYYESVKSDSQEVYGLKQQHIMNGFYAIGQLDYRAFALKKTLTNLI